MYAHITSCPWSLAFQGVFWAPLPDRISSGGFCLPRILLRNPPRGLRRGFRSAMVQPIKLGGCRMADDADAIVVGAGLAGLVAAAELADAGKRVIIVDQEGEQSLGGQAFWSFG